jgi:hypothetical protein
VDIASFVDLTPKGQGGQNGFLRFWAAYCECTLFLEFLKLFVVVDMDGSFPMSHSMQHLDSRFMSYNVFKISALLRAGSQPLPMQQILPKTAQNCQKLPKSAQKQNFEIPLKIKILEFFKNKNLYM